MARSRAYSSCSSIDYQIPCTSESEGRLCDIFRDITSWNKFLSDCGLELTEPSPGQLSLVVVPHPYGNRNTQEHIQTTATRLHHLLTRHHCVTSVEMRVWMFWRHLPLMCDAFRKCLSLRKLKLVLHWDYFTHPPVKEFAAVFGHLKHLRELDCGGTDFDRSFVEGLSEFLASTRSLTTLTLSELAIVHEEDAYAILQGLRRNESITKLAFNTCLMGSQKPFSGWPHRLLSPPYAVAVADYLSENKTLRTLTVSPCVMEHFGVVRPVIGALFKNYFLTELSIVKLTLKGEDMELITQLLSENRTLTSFHLIGCGWNEPAWQHGADGEHSAGVTSRIRSILVALTKNTTLQVLTLTPSWFDTNECRRLFEVVASHASLKKVNFDVSERQDAADIYRAVRETGAQDRFFLGTHDFLPRNVVAFAESKQPSGASVGRHVSHGYGQLLATLSMHPSCGHVTSLSLHLKRELLNARVSSLMAQFIVRTTTLSDLKLRFDVTEVGDAVHGARRVLVQALSVNKSLRRLKVFGSWSDVTETQLLADKLQSSRTLCHVSFFPDKVDCTTSLVRNLSPDISSNYTLLSMCTHENSVRCGDWFRVSDVMRRNCSLVTRAAHFVVGKRLKYRAAAAELVHSSPALVEKVQELASVDEHEAASRIKKSLKSFSDLDEFMRLAGVVKYGVKCHSRDDGQKQLVDIGRHCWMYLREYLKVGDILDG